MGYQVRSWSETEEFGQSRNLQNWHVSIEEVCPEEGIMDFVDIASGLSWTDAKKLRDETRSQGHLKERFISLL